jgi:hypothetical protein
MALDPKELQNLLDDQRAPAVLARRLNFKMRKIDQIHARTAARLGIDLAQPE